MGHSTLAFNHNADLLGHLTTWVTTLLSAKGLFMSLTMAKYVLACYHSQDPGFSLETVLEGIHCTNNKKASMVK